MEPTDLKSNSADDAPLDALLRTTLAAPPLADDGFSQRVLAALPASAPPPKAALRMWLCAGGAIAGCLITAVSFSHGRVAETGEQISQLLASLRTSFAPLADGSLLLGLVATAVSLAFVYWRELLAKLLR